MTRFLWPDRDTIQKCDAFSLARRVTVKKELSLIEILSRSVTRFHWPGASLSIKNYHRQRYYPEVWRVFIGPTEILSWRVFIARRVTVTWICRYDRRWTSSGDTLFVHNNIMCVRISSWCFDFCFLLLFFYSCVITASSHHASSEAHIGLFGGKKVSEQEFQRPQHHNHLTTISRGIRDAGA